MAPGRGRRGEKKKEHEQNQLDADFIPLEDDVQVGQSDGPARDNRSSFFGLLDRSELEYFKNAESVLATNALNLNEREPFIENLFEEARGKELKLATNQVCSKLVERMVQLASTPQILQLLNAFEPFSTDLAYQKFSSHCLEAVILKSIPIPEATETLAALAKRFMEFSLDLVYDQYASHVLSCLILALSGLDENLRSKKSQLARKHTEIAGDVRTEVAEVPAPLRKCGCQLVSQLVSSLDPVEARKLAIDPVTSPVLQSMIMAEASLMSAYTLVDLILKEGSAGFVSHCLSDNVGSHFLDTVIKVLPAKKAGKLVNSFSLEKLASSENNASRFLVQAVIAHSNLPKRRKVDLLQNELKPFLGKNVGLSLAALDTDFKEFAPAVTAGLGSDESLDLQQPSRTALFEKLSEYGPFVEKAVDSVIAMDDKSLTQMGLDATQSFVLQSLLKPSAPLVARRKLLNKLVALVPSWVSNAYGSHIVDSMWSACYRLKFARERIANELLKLEEAMKHSPYGRKVWKNWNMEKYLRKRNDWYTIVKQEEDQLKETLDPGAKTGIAKAAEDFQKKERAQKDSSQKKRKLES